METETEAEDTRPLEISPWTYTPQQWDQQELREVLEQNLGSSTVQGEISVVLIGEGGETKDTVIQAKEHCFLLQPLNRRVLYSHVRYVTTNLGPLRSNAPEDRFVIMVSTRVHPEKDMDIANMYVKPESAQQALTVINFFNYHIFQYLKKVTNEKDPSVIQQFVRPMLVQEYEMKIHWRKERKTFQEKRLAIIDQECLALYKLNVPYQERPMDRMFFWRECVERSSAKVSRIKTLDVIFFQSPHLYVVIECKQTGDDKGSAISDLETAIKESARSVPRKAFEDPNLLLRFLGGDDLPELDEIPEGESLEISPSDSGKLETLGEEFKKGKKKCAKDRQAGLIWDQQRPNLEIKLSDPERLQQINLKDIQQEWNPNSVDHFLKAVELVESALFLEVDYLKALATTVAIRSLFLQSRVINIRRMVEASPLELLYTIYARGNVSGKKKRGRPEEDDPMQEDDVTPDEEMMDDEEQ